MIKIKGEKELFKKFNNFEVDLTKAVSKVVGITAFSVQKRAQASLNTVSNGRVYKRGKKTHTASKEGDSPNTDTGELVGSIQVDYQAPNLNAFVGTDKEYGFFLETEKNRPWLEPAKEEETKDFEERLITSINKQILEA